MKCCRKPLQVVTVNVSASTALSLRDPVQKGRLWETSLSTVAAPTENHTGWSAHKAVRDKAKDSGQYEQGLACLQDG